MRSHEEVVKEISDVVDRIRDEYTFHYGFIKGTSGNCLISIAYRGITKGTRIANDYVCRVYYTCRNVREKHNKHIARDYLCLYIKESSHYVDLHIPRASYVTDEEIRSLLVFDINCGYALSTQLRYAIYTINKTNNAIFCYYLYKALKSVEDLPMYARFIVSSNLLTCVVPNEIIYTLRRVYE